MSRPFNYKLAMCKQFLLLRKSYCEVLEMCCVLIISIHQLLKSDDSFTISQAAGALSECSIRNDANKTLVSASGAIPLLVSMLQASSCSFLNIFC